MSFRFLILRFWGYSWKVSCGLDFVCNILLTDFACRRDHALFTLFVLLANSGVQHILCCVFCLFFFGLCIDDVLSINTSRFAEFLPLIYPPELEVKETTETASSASFLDLYLEFDDCGQLGTKMYDKRDDFNFKIINFPNMCSNIPASPAYGVYISQLIRYTRASSNYSDFLKRHLHLRNRLLDQGY